MTTPRVSVVMAVYNGGAHLARTLDSLLAQTLTDFELIVVDDGSTDGTLPILAAYRRRDPRIRMITQTNSGLTRALIRGCAEARAPLIAREDCGDRSRPERLRMQAEVFDKRGDAVLCACAVEVFAPDGEAMYTVGRDGDRVRQSLLHDDVHHIKGLPSHPSAMFRADAYRRAGGYREEFYFAQDLDLWIRLAPLGQIVVLPEVLHDVRFEATAISGRARKEQVRSAEIAIAIRDAASADERARLLESARRVRPRRRHGARRAAAAGHYFIGRTLQTRGDANARKYLRRAVKADPFMLRAWLALARKR